MLAHGDNGTMNANRWWSYVEETLDGNSALEAGRRAGFDSSAFTRWKKGARPDVYFVVKLARAYNRNVLGALAAAEFITDAEADIHEEKVGLDDLSLEVLAAEVSNRLDQALRASVLSDASLKESTIRR